MRTPLHNNLATIAKPLLRALRGETVIPPPLWLMRQAGRYLPEYRRIRASVHDFLELCYSPELAVEVTLQPVRRYGLDAAILFSDILTVPDALGQPVVFHEGRGPILDPLKGKADVACLSLDRLESHLAPVYEAVRYLAKALPPDVALIGFAGAPWTVATYMVEGRGSKDFSRVKAWALWEQPLFRRLTELLTEATIRHLLAQIAVGADAVQIFDTWAGVLPGDEFHRWVIEPITSIVSAVHKSYPDVPIIVFPRGAGILYRTVAIRTGVQAVSVDSSVSPAWAARYLQRYVTVQGNLDPLILAAGGESMREEVYCILDTLGCGPFVFNLGHGVIPETPPEHVAQLVGYVRAWRGPSSQLC